MFVLWDSGRPDFGLQIVDIEDLDLEKTVEALTEWDQDPSCVVAYTDNLTILAKKKVMQLAFVLEIPTFFEWRGAEEPMPISKENVARWYFARHLLRRDWDRHWPHREELQQIYQVWEEMGACS